MSKLFLLLLLHAGKSEGVKEKKKKERKQKVTQSMVHIQARSMC